MRRLSAPRLVLAAAAFIGWGLFILACVQPPAWSPDGKRILFSYIDHARDTVGVAMYDRDTDQATIVYSRKGDDSGVMPQWVDNGRQPIVVICGGGNISVVLPEHSGEPARTIEVHQGGGEDCDLVQPLPEVDGKLFVSVQETSYVVDYVSGNVLSHRAMDGPVVMQNGRLYELEMSDNADEVKVSTFDAKDFTTSPVFQLSKDDLRAKGLDIDQIFIGNAAISPTGEDIAIPVLTKTPPSTIVLLNRKGELQFLQPDFGFRKVDLGAVAWSIDGVRVYATAMVDVPGSSARMFSIAEIPRVKGKAQIFPVVVYHDGNRSGDDLLSAPISISPDGATLATSTAAFPDNSVTPEDRALFLVDIGDPDNPPKKVKVPGLEPPATGEVVDQ